MSRKVMAAIAAGAILVIAGLVFSLVSFLEPARAQEESPSEDVAPRALGFLERVLDELVSEGTIEQDDADAVLTAVEEGIEEFRAKHPQLDNPRLHFLHKGARIGALLDDGGITEEEYDELPEDSPIRELDLEDALSDGLITLEELRKAWQAGDTEEEPSG